MFMGIRCLFESDLGTYLNVHDKEPVKVWQFAASKSQVLASQHLKMWNLLIHQLLGATGLK